MVPVFVLYKSSCKIIAELSRIDEKIKTVRFVVLHQDQILCTFFTILFFFSKFLPDLQIQVDFLLMHFFIEWRSRKFSLGLSYEMFTENGIISTLNFSKITRSIMFAVLSQAHILLTLLKVEFQAKLIVLLQWNKHVAVSDSLSAFKSPKKSSLSGQCHYPWAFYLKVIMQARIFQY